jgi:hypothetical protein
MPDLVTLVSKWLHEEMVGCQWYGSEDRFICEATDPFHVSDARHLLDYLPDGLVVTTVEGLARALDGIEWIFPPMTARRGQAIQVSLDADAIAAKVAAAIREAAR